MTAWIATVFALISALFLAGCDKQGQPIEQFGLDKLAKGISTEGDVRAVMGPPDTVWEEEDGARIMEYPKGPEGARSWMFRIDPNGKMQDYHQALTAENFAKVQPGMTKGDVRWLLGKPRSVVPYKLSGEEVWDWRYLATNPGRQLFNVHFDMQTGKVKRVSNSDDPKEIKS